ncbi:MAG TPA: hypothetical protein PKX92_11970 [Edaphocola sp.]|nr:hypothetical protein [Edaphocola sp.]
MKKYFENVFACIFAGYKESEKDELFLANTTISVSRTLRLLLLGQAGILFVIIAGPFKLFDLNYNIDSSYFYTGFLIACVLIGALDFNYFTDKRAEELCSRFYLKSDMQRGLLRLLVAFHLTIPTGLSFYILFA